MLKEEQEKLVIAQLQQEVVDLEKKRSVCIQSIKNWVDRHYEGDNSGGPIMHGSKHGKKKSLTHSTGA